MKSGFWSRQTSPHEPVRWRKTAQDQAECRYRARLAPEDLVGDGSAWPSIHRPKSCPPSREDGTSVPSLDAEAPAAGRPPQPVDTPARRRCSSQHGEGVRGRGTLEAPGKGALLFLLLLVDAGTTFRWFRGRLHPTPEIAAPKAPNLYGKRVHPRAALTNRPRKTIRRSAHPPTLPTTNPGNLQQTAQAGCAGCAGRAGCQRPSRTLARMGRRPQEACAPLLLVDAGTTFRWFRGRLHPTPEIAEENGPNLYGKRGDPRAALTNRPHKALASSAHPPTWARHEP